MLCEMLHALKERDGLRSGRHSIKAIALVSSPPPNFTLLTYWPIAAQSSDNQSRQTEFKSCEKEESYCIFNETVYLRVKGNQDKIYFTIQIVQKIKGIQLQTDVMGKVVLMIKDMLLQDTPQLVLIKCENKLELKLKIKSSLIDATRFRELKDPHEFKIIKNLLESDAESFTSEEIDEGVSLQDKLKNLKLSTFQGPAPAEKSKLIDSNKKKNNPAPLPTKAEARDPRDRDAHLKGIEAALARLN